MSTAGPTVFLVDDDEAVLRGLGRLVKSAGYAVETFSSPSGLLARAPYDGVGCVVLDLRMPEWDGLQAQEALTRAGHTFPIVFLTGHGDVPSSVQAMKAGAVDFLTKPPEERDLLDAIRRAIAQDEAAYARRTEHASLMARFEALTPREREVCTLVAAGLRNKQIAARLGTSEKTVKIHRGQVMHKMGSRSVADLVRIVDRLRATVESETGRNVHALDQGPIATGGAHTVG
jgi:FixJ family two-component response regulator